MEKIVRQTLLYDFYGELLTSHQRKLYEDVVFGDLSLSEIAQEQGISRQGVHDLIRRCDRIMEEYEEKLQLIRRFSETKKQVDEIRRLTSGAAACGELSGEREAQVSDLAGSAAEENQPFAADMQRRLVQIGQLCDRIMEIW